MTIAKAIEKQAAGHGRSLMVVFSGMQGRVMNRSRTILA
jgi:hypothetical protein